MGVFCSPRRRAYSLSELAVPRGTSAKHGREYTEGDAAVEGTMATRWLLLVARNMKDEASAQRDMSKHAKEAARLRLCHERKGELRKAAKRTHIIDSAGKNAPVTEESLNRLITEWLEATC